MQKCHNGIKIGGDVGWYGTQVQVQKCQWNKNYQVPNDPHQFLFCSFCSADLFALALRVPNSQCLRVAWGPQGSPLIFILLFLFCWVFCTSTWYPQGSSQIFIPLFFSAGFVLQFLFRWPFCTCTWVPKGPHQFLFHIFVPLTFLHLQLCVCGGGGGPHHLATQYTMHTNIPNIQNPNFSWY